ncbi:MAG: PilW family protein [Candidatus Saccharimonadales bacterium]
MSKARTLHSGGFTIVELMVATLVFSVILVVITSGVIHFTAEYYKGVNTSATQTVARNITNIIAQNLQYGGGPGVYDGTNAAAGYVCVGSTRIDYNVGHQFTGSGDYGVVVSADSCSHTYPPAAGSQPKEYLAPNMRVTNVGVTPVPGTLLYKISVGVAYGDPDLLCATNVVPAINSGGCSPTQSVPATPAWWAAHGAFVGCKGGAGSQFCAAAHLNTEVVSRFAH